MFFFSLSLYSTVLTLFSRVGQQRVKIFFFLQKRIVPLHWGWRFTKLGRHNLRKVFPENSTSDTLTALTDWTNDTKSLTLCWAPTSTLRPVCAKLCSFHTSLIDGVCFFLQPCSCLSWRLCVRGYEWILQGCYWTTDVQSVLRVNVSKQLPCFPLMSSSSLNQTLFLTVKPVASVCVTFGESYNHLSLSILQQHQLWLCHAKVQPELGGLQDDPGEQGVPCSTAPVQHL